MGKITKCIFEAAKIKCMHLFILTSNSWYRKYLVSIHNFTRKWDLRNKIPLRAKPSTDMESLFMILLSDWTLCRAVRFYLTSAYDIYFIEGTHNAVS